MAKNIFYAQSGGVTAVINATACGVIETARKSRQVGKVLAGKNGIIGALREELIDTSKESAKAIAGLRHTPSGAFGSCRYKLKSLEENAAEYRRLIDVFRAHDIGYFFYNGGGGGQTRDARTGGIAPRPSEKDSVLLLCVLTNEEKRWNASKWRFLDRRGSGRGGWREENTGPWTSLNAIRGCIGSLEGARNARLVASRTSSGRRASCP